MKIDNESDKTSELAVVIRNGSAEFVYTDELVDLLKEGPASIKRASNVEPVTAEIDGKQTFLGWRAYMEDKTSLGPFKSRQEALSAEVEYLKEKMFK